MTFRRPPTGTAAHSGPIGRAWIAGAALIVVLGILGSVFAARAVARNDGQKSERAFAASSADTVARLRLAILREQDLVVSAGAFLVSNPHATNASFNQWARANRAFERYPELVGLARIVIVPAAQLAAYAAHAARPNTALHIIPPGVRPFYCFVDLNSAQRGGAAPMPTGIPDLCAGSAGARLIASRDSGQGTYEPYQLGPITALGIQTPLYRGGRVPATVAGRRAAFIGWVANGLMPRVIVQTALAGKPNTAATLTFRLGSTPISVNGGRAPRGAQSLSTDLHNGWTVRTSATVADRGVADDENALAVLAGGITLSLLLGLLGAVLATGRTRALRHVDEQTLELREQARELHATVDELEAAQAIKDEFLGLVSHELRTPLTSICGYTELLKDEGMSAEQQDYINVIDRNAVRLIGLVEDLLLMAQIQTGGLPLELGEVILNDLIARSGEAARPFAASKEIAIDIDVEPGVAAEGDAVRLSQVIDNLVSNAIKYTPNGGDVSITMTRTGDTATIAVSDTGIGIPTAEREQMFGRFFRTSNARDSGVEGTGLGLAITRGIVEAHGGTISFDSVEGAGSTFRITLPHAHDASLASAA